jgi:WD40 repeat protein
VPRHPTVWRICTYLAAGTLLAACAVATLPTPPSRGATPSAEEIRDLVLEPRGKPIEEAPVAPGTIQVVAQTGHAGAIYAVAISADGRYILSTSMDETAKLWDAASGQELRTFTGLDMAGAAADFVTGTDRLVLGTGFYGQRIIDLASGRTLKTLGGSVLRESAVSPGGKFAALSNTQKPAFTISVIDLGTDAVVATLPTEGQIMPVALSADGRVVLLRRLDISTRKAFTAKSAFPDMQFEAWDASTGKLRSTLHLSSGTYEQPTTQVLSPDGSLLATQGFDELIKIYDTTTGAQKLSIAKSASQWPGDTTLHFSPDGHLLAGNTQQHVQIWEIPSGRLITEFDGSAVNFAADGRTLVTAHQGTGTPIVRDLESGRETPLSGGASAISDLALLADGSAVIAATETRGARYWDLKTGQLVRNFECAGGGGVYSVSTSPTAPLLALGCYDGAVSLWNLQTGTLVRTLHESSGVKYGVITNVRFDPSGRRLAWTSNEQLVLWDVAANREIQRIAVPRIQSAFDTMTNGAQQADVDGLPQMPQAMRERMDALKNDPAMIGLQNAARAIAFSPDGARIAVGKDQGAALLFDLATGQLIRQFSGGLAARAEQPASPDQDVLSKMMSGGRLSRKDMKALMKAQRNAPFGGAVALDPAAALDDIVDVGGARSLAFSADGRTLLTLGLNGQRIWDVESGRRLDRPRQQTIDLNDPNSIGDLIGHSLASEGADLSTGILMSPDGRLVARGHGNRIALWDVTTAEDVAELRGHTSAVTSLAFAAGGRVLISGARDGTVRVWKVPERNEVVQLIALGSTDYVAVTPDQYYRASKRRIDGVAFRVNDRVYPFEQFDLRFNRPDIVLERLGSTPSETIQSFRTAYERRLKKLGFTESMLAGDFHLPEVALVGAGVPVTTSAATLALRLRATDDKYALERIHVFVNDVPVFGTSGLAIGDTETRSHEQEVSVPLVPGRNKIQISVLNAQGAESLKQTVYTTSTADPGPSDVYVVAIGVSEYRNNAYNLRFAAKDALDLVSAYRDGAPRGAMHGQVHILDLTNEKATRTGIRQAKEWLKQARVNDLVVVFAAGHGMTDARQDYYFGTYDIDPAHPELAGLPYEDFEGLLDGIAALKKVLLIDTCFSGEIEKDQTTILAQAQTEGAGQVSMRAFKSLRGVQVVADDAAGSATVSGDVLRFQQELFADLRRGTGAVVISSASGNEYALEGEQWSNGVFTYALLNGLKNARADADGNGEIAVSELQAYVIEEVRKLTAGGQNPTVRRENLDYDFAVF